jgi:hypothetical protein
MIRIPRVAVLHPWKEAVIMKKPRGAIVAEMAKQSILAGLVLLLVGLVQPCRAGTFFDNFNDGNADGWVFPYNYNTTQWPGGEWTVEDGTLVQHSGGDGNCGLVNSLVLSDQVIEVQVHTVGYAGVVFWYNQVTDVDANDVSVGYAEQTGYWVNERVVDGTDVQIIYPGPWIGGAVYNLKVEVDSAAGILKVYKDGVYLFTHTLSTPYRTGLSGVYSGNAAGYFDNLQVTSAIPAIDIVPGSPENPINLKKPGTVSVAILSAPNFDAPVQVNWTSLTFGRTGDEAHVTSCNKKAKDVNGDGLPDLVCVFSISAAGFQAGDTKGMVKGRTTEGISFVSSDTVTIHSGK